MRNLLLAIFCLLACNSLRANNVLIEIYDPEGIFDKCTLQRTFYGNIPNSHNNRSERLILSSGRKIELQVDSFLVAFLINQDKHWFNQPVFITAGDTIILTAQKLKVFDGYIFYKLVASGKNEDNYNFLAETHDNYEKYIPLEDVNIEEYKEYHKNKKDMKLSLIKEKSHNLSIPFYNYSLAEIENKYTWRIYNAALFEYSKANQTLRDERNINLESFVDGTHIVENLLSYYYYTAIWEKFCYDFHVNKWDSEKAIYFLINNYSGQEREYLLTQYVGWCVHNKIQITDKIGDAIEEHIHDSYYLKCIKDFLSITKEE